MFKSSEILGEELHASTSTPLPTSDTPLIYYVLTVLYASGRGRGYGLPRNCIGNNI